MSGRSRSKDPQAGMVPLMAFVAEDGPSDVSSYTVHMNNPTFPEERLRKLYPDNYVRTTKYTVLTFLPLNLFQQFMRFYNLYFLLAAVLTIAIPSASPVSPALTVLPLLVVLGVTMIKDIFEDYLRYTSDRQANNIQVRVSRLGSPLRAMKSQDILPGDLLEIKRGEAFPADIILLSSSHEDGHCFIQTAQLDGETNLKRRFSVLPDVQLSPETEQHFIKALAQVDCQHPNKELYKFEGRLQVTFAGEDRQSNSFGLRPSNILLRGSELRNTDRIFGMAVYVGRDTKIMMNLKQTRLKFSSLEGRLNKMVLSVFAYNALIFGVSVLLSGIWQSREGFDSWYIGWNVSGLEVAGFHSATYFVLWTYLIPISLFVTLEVCRLGQAFFMNWDEQMIGKIEDKEVPMKVNNSNLNEDLGRVDHIFSDKTGTLTQNIMRVVAWFAGETVYSERLSSTDFPSAIPSELSSDGALAQGIVERAEYSAERLMLLGRSIALCNTIVPTVTMVGGQTRVIYDGDSPDEVALLEGLRHNGFLLRERTRSGVVLEIDKKLLLKISESSLESNPTVYEGWEILQTLEFNSDRKRMSVIARASSKSVNGEGTGPIFLICKGADSIIIPRLSEDKKTVNQLQESIDKFSREGLRTLVVASRELSMEEYVAFDKAYREADRAVGDRDQQMAKINDAIEKNFRLVGCTAVEDKLQENVAETIAYLMEAGIHFWMLTGDKKQTAVSIGISCRLVRDGRNVLFLEGDSPEATLANVDALIRRVGEIQKDNIALVVEGFTLTFALTETVSDRFLFLCEQCASVICCRVSPLQKADVVALVKSKLQRVCLGIGDGANDVSMIQIANIGVGIVGKEGSQAVRASDYSFVEFKNLQRLLSVHGRYSYLRMTDLIFYSFYKNLAFIMVCFWFGFYSGWSGQSIYNDKIMSMFNVLYVFLPPFVIGIFERDISERVIERQPKLYTESGQGGAYFNVLTFSGWMSSALWHSLVIYFGFFLMFNPDGTDVDFRTMSLYYSTASVTLVLLRVALMIRQWVWPYWLALFLSYLVYVVSVILVGLVFEYRGSLAEMLGSGMFWFGMILILPVALLPDFIVKYYKRLAHPFDWQVFQEQDVIVGTEHADGVAAGERLLGSRSQRKGGYGTVPDED